LVALVLAKVQPETEPEPESEAEAVLILNLPVPVRGRGRTVSYSKLSRLGGSGLRDAPYMYKEKLGRSWSARAQLESVLVFNSKRRIEQYQLYSTVKLYIHVM
jgi:hypothetical protein